MLLTIGRRGVGDPFDVTVIRDIIKVPSVRSRELMEGYLWLGVQQRDTDESVPNLVTLNDGPLRGIVLDLRNNPGGVLGPASTWQAFLDGGLVVYTEGRHTIKDRFGPHRGTCQRGPHCNAH